MNIFFTVGRTKAKKQNIALIDKILSKSNKVVTKQLLTGGKPASGLNFLRRVELYAKIYQEIKNADIIAAEATYPTSKLEFELGLASALKKQIILLFSQETSAEIKETEFPHTNIQTIEYNGQDLKSQLVKGLNLSRAQIDQRFTILLSPRIISFLDERCEEQKIPKSVYIRHLIEQQIDARRSII